MRESQCVDILGSKWEIIYMTSENNKHLENCAGYTDTSARFIIAQDYSNATKEQGEHQNPDEIQKRIVRHEIIHAFLSESGLDICAHDGGAWALNEEMVDWLALQGVKIYQAWLSVGAV